MTTPTTAIYNQARVILKRTIEAIQAGTVRTEDINSYADLTQLSDYHNVESAVGTRLNAEFDNTLKNEVFHLYKDWLAANQKGVNSEPTSAG